MRRFIIALALAASLGCSSTKIKNNEVQKPLSPEEHARLLIEVGNAALLENDPTGALRNFLDAQKFDDNLPELHHSKALAFYAKHDTRSALKSARRAVELKPDYSDANNTLGKLLMDAGENAEAEKYLQLAAEDPIYRDAYKAQTSLGIIYYRNGEFEKARVELDRAIQSAPQAACIAYYYHGHLMLRDSDVKSAVKDYDHATQRACAGFVDAQFALGVAYTRNKQYELARKKFLEITQRYPNTEVAERAMDNLRYLP